MHLSHLPASSACRLPLLDFEPLEGGEWGSFNSSFSGATCLAPHVRWLIVFCFVLNEMVEAGEWKMKLHLESLYIGTMGKGSGFQDLVVLPGSFLLIVTTGLKAASHCPRRPLPSIQKDRCMQGRQSQA